MPSRLKNVVISLILIAFLCQIIPTWFKEYGFAQIDSAIANQDIATAQLYLTLIDYLVPHTPQFYQQLSQSYLSLNDTQNALHVIQQALEASPDDPDLLLTLGDVYDHLKQFEQAISAYEAGGVGDRGGKLAFNYLSLVERYRESGLAEQATSILHNKVYLYGDADLYVHWQLAQQNPESSFYVQQLEQTSIDTIFAPKSDEWLPYHAQAMMGIVRDGWWTRERLLTLIAYIIWTEPAQDSERFLKALLNVEPNDADLHFYLGEVYYLRRNWELAKTTYQQVVSIDESYRLAYLRLGNINEMRFVENNDSLWLEQAQQWYLRYNNIVPGDPLVLKRLADLCQHLQCIDQRWQAQLNDYLHHQEPKYIVNETYDNWYCAGYDVDLPRLLRGEPTTLWLYWEPMGEIGQSILDDDNAYQLDNRLVQVFTVQNMVTNGGFEASYEPIGFPNKVLMSPDIPIEARTVTSGMRDSMSTSVGLLSNSPEFNTSSFATSYFPVEEKRYYLQTGSLKSVNGLGYLGRQWSGNLNEGVTNYSYTANKIARDYWTDHPGIIQAPDGATGVQLWLLNYQATGQVQFDDIVFVELGELSHLK